MSTKPKAIVAVLSLIKDNINYRSASFDSMYLIRATKTPSTSRFLNALSENVPSLSGLDVDTEFGKTTVNGIQVILSFKEISHDAASILMNEKLIPFIDFVEEDKQHEV